MKDTYIKDILLLSLAFTASAVMLTVIQPPISWSLLAWVSLVPFILACSPETKTKPLVLVAYVASLCYWLGNLYWVFPITIIGWAAFCLYIAVLLPMVALSLRFCRAKKIPLFIAAGVLFIGAERLQGFFLGGFFWRFLAHSQYQNITLIQIADMFGAAGVSFLIAMVNGLIAELIIAARQKRIFKIRYFIQTAIVCAAVVACIIYGRFRINQSDKYIEAGPLAASVQSNIPQSVKRTFQADKEIFDDLMADSRECLTTDAELVIWPETMVQVILDSDIWPFLVSSENAMTYDQSLRKHSKDTAFVLVGAYGGKIQQQNNGQISLLRYNSAFLYRPDGKRDSKRYDKIHLVLFGEYLPFRKSLPWLYNLLMKFTPFNYDYSLEPGSEYTIFEMSKSQNQKTKKYKFGVIICYEDTIPAIVRRFTLDEQGKKRIDWLVNISNDGWFVRFKDHPKRVIPSTELSQHAAICAFRAVENRMAIIRSVNTGISCLIDSLGRIRNGYVAASADFPVIAIEREGMSGWFVDKMPIDKRVTLFSKYGQWLDFCCAVCLGVVIIMQFFGRIFKVKKHK